MKQIDIYDRLQSFLEEKYSVLKQYLSITEEMSVSVEYSNFRELGILMANRQQCLRKVESMDKSIQALIGPENKITRLSRKLDEILNRYHRDYISIMKAVCPVDEKIMFLVESKSDKLRKELLKFQKNRNAVTSYRPQQITGSRYLDSKN